MLIAKKRIVIGRVWTVVIIMLGIIFSGTVSFAANNCQCVSYARCATGINIYGNGCDWDNNASKAGYKVGSTPVVNGAINFEKGAYGADKNYGHVAKVFSYKSDGSYWKVKVRHANWSGPYFKDCSCDNVSEKEFRVKKGDNSIHFIYKK